MSNRLGLGSGFSYPNDDRVVNDAYVTWLAHFDGVTNSTYAIDYSPKQNGYIYMSGGALAYLYEPTKKFGQSSIVFQGNGLAYSPVNVDSSFNLGAQDFTIDWWEYRSGAAGTPRPSWVWDTIGAVYVPMLVGWYDGTDPNLYFYASNDQATWNMASAFSMGPLTFGVWNHFAIVRKNNTVYIFKNGVNQSTSTMFGAFNNATYGPCLGCWPRSDGYIYYLGFIDEFRVSKGIARWITNFTPPNAPYGPDPSDLATVLLMQYGNGWLDTSQYRRGAATLVGGPLITSPGKFDRYAAYFDGASGLTYPDHADWSIGDNYTVDLWLRPAAWPAAGQAGTLVAHWGNDGWLFILNSDGAISLLQRQASAGGDFSVYGGVAAVNSWTHVALVRSNRVWTIYINGVGGVPVTTPVLPVVAFPLYIGMLSGTTYPLTGNIDELRITKGRALWTANFTPPTDVYPRIMQSPVVLLMHFDGGFNDASQYRRAKAIVTGSTVTADPTKKFGLYSAKFTDGMSGLTFPDSPSFDLGLLDFTMDVWFNCTAATGTIQRLFGKRTSTAVGSTSFRVRRETTNVLTAAACSSNLQLTVTGTTQFSNTLNTGWHHLAFVRTSNILKMFIDGVQEGGDVAMANACNNVGSFGVGCEGIMAGANGDWIGYIDELRVTRGVALWTSNFTPPVGPST